MRNLSAGTWRQGCGRTEHVRMPRKERQKPCWLCSCLASGKAAQIVLREVSGLKRLGTSENKAKNVHDIPLYKAQTAGQRPDLYAVNL